MANEVNYTVQYDQVSVNAGGIWADQDVDGGGADAGAVPLEMTISPNQGYMVNAVDFNIAGQTYSESSEISTGLMSYTYYATDLEADSLPLGVNRVTIEDMGVGTGNTVKVKAWIDFTYQLPITNTSLILDIDGDAQEAPPPQTLYFDFGFSPATINEGETSELKLYIGPASLDQEGMQPSITPYIVDDGGTDLSLTTTANYQPGTADVVTSYTTNPQALLCTSSPNGTEMLEMNFLNYNTGYATPLTFVPGFYACEDSNVEGVEYLTVKLPPYDSLGNYTGELEATLAITNTTIPTIQGCTDSSALNYNPDATSNDGSCIFAGCTDPTAANYCSECTVDDGSCVSGYDNSFVKITVVTEPGSNLRVCAVPNYGYSQWYSYSTQDYSSEMLDGNCLVDGGITDDCNTITLNITDPGVDLTSVYSRWHIYPEEGYAVSRHNITFSSNVAQPGPYYTTSSASSFAWNEGCTPYNFSGADNMIVGSMAYKNSFKNIESDTISLCTGETTGTFTLDTYGQIMEAQVYDTKINLPFNEQYVASGDIYSSGSIYPFDNINDFEDNFLVLTFPGLGGFNASYYNCAQRIVITVLGSAMELEPGGQESVDFNIIVDEDCEGC